jgi:mono/diheme cytochrome c family protein
MKRPGAWVLAVALALQAGAAEQRKDWASPGGQAAQDRSSSSPAEALYVEKCGMCHRQMGMGTVILARRQPRDRAMLEQRDDLTVPFITLWARNGMGNMPRISRGEVSDEQMALIATYLARGQQP